MIFGLKNENAIPKSTSQSCLNGEHDVIDTLSNRAVPMGLRRPAEM